MNVVKNGDIFTSQKMMEQVANKYWAGIMTKKNVNQEHMKTVIGKIKRFLPPESVTALNKHDTDLISIQAIKDSIMNGISPKQVSGRRWTS